MIPTATALAQAFANIINGLRLGLRLAAARVPALAPLLLLIVHNRLGRMVQRLDRLTLLWQTGRLPKPHPPRAARATASQPAAERPYLPTGQAWLLRLAQPAAHAISHVERFLVQSDTQALIRATPQAGRILRPLCRMLGIPLPVELRLPPRPPAPQKSLRTVPPRRQPRSYQDFIAKLPRPAAPGGPNFHESHIFRT